MLLVTAVEGFRVHILHPEFDEKDVEIKLLFLVLSWINSLMQTFL